MLLLACPPALVCAAQPRATAGEKSTAVVRTEEKKKTAAKRRTKKRRRDDVTFVGISGAGGILGCFDGNNQFTRGYASRKVSEVLACMTSASASLSSSSTMEPVAL